MSSELDCKAIGFTNSTFSILKTLIAPRYNYWIKTEGKESVLILKAVAMGLFVFYISEKLYHKYFRDYYLQCNTPKYVSNKKFCFSDNLNKKTQLSLFNSKHPLVPPMPLPYRKPGDESVENIFYIIF